MGGGGCWGAAVDFFGWLRRLWRLLVWAARGGGTAGCDCLGSRLGGGGAGERVVTAGVSEYVMAEEFERQVGFWVSPFRVWTAADAASEAVAAGSEGGGVGTTTPEPSSPSGAAGGGAVPVDGGDYLLLYFLVDSRAVGTLDTPPGVRYPVAGAANAATHPRVLRFPPPPLAAAGPAAAAAWTAGGCPSGGCWGGGSSDAPGLDVLGAALPPPPPWPPPPLTMRGSLHPAASGAGGDVGATDNSDGGAAPSAQPPQPSPPPVSPSPTPARSAPPPRTAQAVVWHATPLAAGMSAYVPAAEYIVRAGWVPSDLAGGVCWWCTIVDRPQCLLWLVLVRVPGVEAVPTAAGAPGAPMDGVTLSAPSAPPPSQTLSLPTGGCGPADDGVRVTLLERGWDGLWVNVTDGVRFLCRDDRSPGAVFVAYTSEASGYAHLYVRSVGWQTPAGATDGVDGVDSDVADPPAVAVTAGDWMVETVLLVDAASGLVLFTGTRDSVLERHVYATALPALSSAAGRGCLPPGPRPVTRVTLPGGFVSGTAVWRPSGGGGSAVAPALVAATASSLTSPPTTVIYAVWPAAASAAASAPMSYSLASLAVRTLDTGALPPWPLRPPRLFSFTRPPVAPATVPDTLYGALYLPPPPPGGTPPAHCPVALRGTAGAAGQRFPRPHCRRRAGRPPRPGHGRAGGRRPRERPPGARVGGGGAAVGLWRSRGRRPAGSH